MRYILSLTLLLISVGCGSSEFTAKESNSKSSKKSVVTGDAQADTGSHDKIQKPSSSTDTDNEWNPREDEPILPTMVSGAFLTGECRPIRRGRKDYIGCEFNETPNIEDILRIILTGKDKSYDLAMSEKNIAPFGIVVELPQKELSGKYQIEFINRGEQEIFKTEVEILSGTKTFLSGKGNLKVNLFEIPNTTTVLPTDFRSLTKKDSFKFANLAVEGQSFSNGFPGVKDLYEWFALEIEGTIELPETGEYQFISYADDGIKVYIDDKLVHVHDGIHPPTRLESPTHELTYGKHKFRVEYFQGPAAHIGLKLLWRINSQDEEVIPPSAFVK